MPRTSASVSAVTFEPSAALNTSVTGMRSPVMSCRLIPRSSTNGPRGASRVVRPAATSSSGTGRIVGLLVASISVVRNPAPSASGDFASTSVSARVDVMST